MSALSRLKVAALTITFVYLTLLALGLDSAQYSKVAGLLLLGLHCFYMAFISILLVCRKASHHNKTIEGFFKQWWRWTTDDYPFTR